MRDISRRDFLAGSVGVLSGVIYSSKVEAENSSAWRHIREWSKEEVGKYSQWIANLYEVKKKGTTKQKLANIDQMFSDDEMNLLNNADFLEEGNSQLSKADLNLINASNHCGSFPKLMFNYYSYRRGLPASTTKIKMERGGDIRYSQGNHPIEVISSVPFNGDFSDYLNAGMNGISGWYNFVSGNFRTAPNLEDTDSVPIKIDRESLVPGVMVYKADGHCLVVAKIDDSGEVHFLDAHPDRSITFNQTLSTIPYVIGISEGDFIEGNVKRAYDGFRAMRLSKIEEGKGRYFSNEEMKEFGFFLDQYVSMNAINELRDSGGLEVNGLKVTSFPQFVRARLQIGVEKPLTFLEITIKELAQMFRERAEFVQESWEEVLSNGPIVFPNDSSSENIYQANGRWEEWSSPSSDVDRKYKYNYLGTRLEEMVSGFPNMKGIDYQGFSSKEDLVEAMLELKDREFASEILTYETSSGQIIYLNFNEIERRLFDLSFNPNHPPELRWGAPENSLERDKMKLFKVPLRTGENLDALRAYNLEKGLRFFSERQTGPTSLNLENNPNEPPFDLLELRLRRLLEAE